MARPDRETLERRVGSLRRALERDPADALAWYGLGRALLELERPGEAAPAFRRALDAKPDYTAAWRELGRALLAQGDPDAALAALREGIALAARTGDLQTGREMETFARRAERQQAGHGPARSPQAGRSPARSEPKASGDRSGGTTSG